MQIKNSGVTLTLDREEARMLKDIIGGLSDNDVRKLAGAKGRHVAFNADLYETLDRAI